VLCLCAALHGGVQPLLHQLVVEEGHRQTTQAAGRLSSIMAVKVLLKQLDRQGGGRGRGREGVVGVVRLIGGEWGDGV